MRVKGEVPQIFGSWSGVIILPSEYIEDKKNEDFAADLTPGFLYLFWMHEVAGPLGFLKYILRE